MSKEHAQPKTLASAAKVVGYHAAEIEEMAFDIGQRMMRDQAEWLDVQMRDLLPPDLYAAGLANEKEQEIGDYLRRHEIKILFIPDRQMLRIMLGQRVHSEFIPQFTVDGEKVDIAATGFVPDPTKN